MRLPGPTVRALAAADVAEVRRMLAADAPPIHRCYAILEDDYRLLSPHEVDQHVATIRSRRPPRDA